MWCLESNRGLDIIGEIKKESYPEKQKEISQYKMTRAPAAEMQSVGSRQHMNL